MTCIPCSRPVFLSEVRAGSCNRVPLPLEASLYMASSLCFDLVLLSLATRPSGLLVRCRNASWHHRKANLHFCSRITAHKLHVSVCASRVYTTPPERLCSSAMACRRQDLRLYLEQPFSSQGRITPSFCRDRGLSWQKKFRPSSATPTPLSELARLWPLHSNLAAALTKWPVSSEFGANRVILHERFRRSCAADFFFSVVESANYC